MIIHIYINKVFRDNFKIVMEFIITIYIVIISDMEV